MDTMTEEVGYALCDSSAVRATAKRHLGLLPFAMAMRVPGIGEARLENGRRVLITWGMNIPKASQFWYAHSTRFSPVWVGADDGSCELILGETDESTPETEWLWAGLRIAQADGPRWEEV